MELTFECPACKAIGTAAPIEVLTEATCIACGHTRPLRREAFEGTNLRACPVCATEDIYTRKDFPQALGLAIVIVGFAISTVFWYLDRPVPALSILLVSALVDMALFYLVPDLTICYRCLSQFRGEGANPEGRYKPFDLATGERYRQERLRIEELKGRATPTPTGPIAPPPP